MNWTVVFVVLGVVVLLGLIFWVVGGNEVSRLREQYFRSVPPPRAQAEESLARHLARLQERYPGKTEVWYLRRVLADLQRDRR
ncbi:hypothetical protein JQX13_05330 [Archangium violaceum]|uniref:hypothetical protein n=1 Tax=Archangium violaceum TaxID=83451 RepID=UPI00193B68D6|nr:hypothetical protein [Archangium violaceum]QRK09560.1 hypothetical protein JQX13_05330 [Archangium violaceum]